MKNLNQFTTKCRIIKNGWSALCKIKNYISNCSYGEFIFGENYNYVNKFKFERLTSNIGINLINSADCNTNNKDYNHKNKDFWSQIICSL